MLLVVWMGVVGVIVFFACRLEKYENNNKPNSLLEPEKETASKETKIIEMRQVFMGLL